MILLQLTFPHKRITYGAITQEQLLLKMVWLLKLRIFIQRNGKTG